MSRRCWLLGLILLTNNARSTDQAPYPPDRHAFTYQGRLLIGTNAAEGSFDLTFSLWDAVENGQRIGSAVTNYSVRVEQGLFTVSLDFGVQVFVGPPRWLLLGVRRTGETEFAELSPRQEITPTPYAVYAANVSANGLTGGSYSNALALENAANRFAGSFTGNGAGLSNLVPAAVVSPQSFGAVGDGVTVDDLAFSNAWFIARTTGATFDFSSRGKSFVISNFVFEMNGSIALGGIGHNLSGRPVIAGYGSAIVHAGANWLMCFTNGCPDLRGIQVRGNPSAPGCLLIAGSPSNGRMEDCVFYGYPNGIAVRSEGLTNWQIDNCHAYYSDIGFRFGPYCDAMRVKARADYCRIGFDFGPFPLTPSWTNVEPLGGTFDLCANACGDGVVYAGRGALINFMAESCTNTFVSLGHQLERHGSTEGNLGFGDCTVWGVWGMGNVYFTNSPIEVYVNGRCLRADVELYGNHHTNAVVKSRTAAGDRTQFDVAGASRAVQLPAVIELSTGERPAMPLNNYGVRHQVNRPLRVLQKDVANYSRPVFEAGTLNTFGAPDPLVAGFYDNGSFANLVSGITLSRLNGFVVTNANATVYGSAKIQGSLTMVAGGITNNGVVWHAGVGSPEGVLAAPAGSLYTRTDGGLGKTLYVKETATGNTGWVAK